MTPRHLGYEFTIFAICCTVAIFVFPAATGCYSVVHGPVTALLSLRTKLKLWLGMAFAALQLRRVRPANFATQHAARELILLTQSDLPGRSAVLRC